MIGALLAVGCTTARTSTSTESTSASTTSNVVRPMKPITVGGVPLIPISSAQHSQCQRAANEIHSPVPCPGLIPDPIPGPESGGTPTIGAVTGYFIWNQYSFQVPSRYVGVPGDTSFTGGPLGHFVIYAGKNLNLDGLPNRPVRVVPSYCKAINQRRSLVVHGSTAKLYECSEVRKGSSVEIDLGHDLLIWRQSGVTCEVSFHGHSRVNQDLDLVVARATSMIFPTKG